MPNASIAKSMKGTTRLSWIAMLSRCFNQKSRGFRWYGARGIKVCDRWMKYGNFLADMGERPKGTTIDRINNDGNYEPGNCRWAKLSTQLKNRRPSSTFRMLTRGVTTMRLGEWENSLGLSSGTIGHRLKCGWSVDRALTEGKVQPGSTRKAKTLTLNNVTKTTRAWAKELGLSHTTIEYRIKQGWPIDWVLSKLRNWECRRGR